MHEFTFRLNDKSLTGAIGPAHGPPLVLLHGVTRCWRDFEAVLPPLAERWQIFALDHRGHGGSDRAADYRVADYAADAIEVLDAHVPAPAILLGHSLGAMVAAIVAAERPHRVRALILEDPPGTTLAQGLRKSPFALQFANMRRLLSSAHSLETLARDLAALPVQRPGDGAVVKLGELRDTNALRFLAECLLRLDPGVLDTLNDGRWLDGLDWFAALPRITTPTLLLRAEPRLGGMLDSREADRIAALIPRCARVDFGDAEHLIHATMPERMLALLDDFLQTNTLLPKRTRP